MPPQSVLRPLWRRVALCSLLAPGSPRAVWGAMCTKVNSISALEQALGNHVESGSVALAPRRFMRLGSTQPSALIK